VKFVFDSFSSLAYQGRRLFADRCGITSIEWDSAFGKDISGLIARSSTLLCSAGNLLVRVKHIPQLYQQTLQNIRGSELIKERQHEAPAR
jgi:Na+-transporting NADH:ubiquinone oxidoreductase subunit NqrB